MLSFVLTVMAVWKVLVPLYLRGWDPVWAGLGITLALTVLIVALVYGFDRCCVAAVSGSFLGILVTCAMGAAFTALFKIHGAVMAYSESLLYAGFQSLSLTRIFTASIFVGASGAVMDLAVDITSAVHEVVQKRPGITRREAVRSGLNVGRAAMVFMAQGPPPRRKHPELQARRLRAAPHRHRLVRSRDRRPVHRPLRGEGVREKP